MARLNITDTLSIDEDELTERFTTASGPGGQNVNKVSTAVELRFDAKGSPSLPGWLVDRLAVLAGSRMTQDGVVVISAERFRSQLRNREDARERLLDLLREAAELPKRRRATRPSAGAKARRLEAKGERSGIKALRRKPDQE